MAATNKSYSAIIAFEANNPSGGSVNTLEVLSLYTDGRSQDDDILLEKIKKDLREQDVMLNNELFGNILNIVRSEEDSVEIDMLKKSSFNDYLLIPIIDYNEYPSLTNPKNFLNIRRAELAYIQHLFNFRNSDTSANKPVFNETGEDYIELLNKELFYGIENETDYVSSLLMRSGYSKILIDADSQDTITAILNNSIETVVFSMVETYIDELAECMLEVIKHENDRMATDIANLENDLATIYNTYNHYNASQNEIDQLNLLQIREDRITSFVNNLDINNIVVANCFDKSIASYMRRHNQRKDGNPAKNIVDFGRLHFFEILNTHKEIDEYNKQSFSTSLNELRLSANRLHTNYINFINYVLSNDNRFRYTLSKEE